jgi:hypothetical protein
MNTATIREKRPPFDFYTVTTRAGLRLRVYASNGPAAMAKVHDSCAWYWLAPANENGGWR